MSAHPLSSPSIAKDPYPVYKRLRESEPVSWWAEAKAWAVLRYDDCVSALRDQRFKADRMEEVLRVKFGEALPRGNIYHQFTRNVMMYVDPPLHTALRRAARAGFDSVAHKFCAQAIAGVARDLVAAIPPGKTEIEAISELVSPMPVRAAVRAFGVPEDDLSTVIPLVDTILTYWSGAAEQPQPLSELLGALEELHAYVDDLVYGARGTIAPGTVIDRLIDAAPGVTECSIDQTKRQLVLLLMAVFAQTTPGSLGSGTLAFALNQPQVDSFRADPSCAKNTANEVFRYNASNQFTWRQAREDITVGGVTIKAGDAVAVFLGSANRDPDAFEEPDQFRLGRKDSVKHLSFGTGVHACLGKQIALLNVGCFFDALFERYASIELAGAPAWHGNLEFRSLKSLPLRVKASSARP